MVNANVKFQSSNDCVLFLNVIEIYPNLNYSTNPTDSERVESSADDDGNGEQLAEAEHVLNGRGQTDAQAVDQSDDGLN